jgi:siroheme synthase (precorrin-2 oxidase/ferrochelatase)
MALDPSYTLAPVMAEPTRDDVDALVGPATPHFAYQIRARVSELVSGLPEGHEVRRYAEQQMERLDRLAHASSKADEGPRESPARLGWDEIPSAAPADRPLPRRA